jgi:hypothetical protein
MAKRLLADEKLFRRRVKIAKSLDRLEKKNNANGKKIDKLQKGYSKLQKRLDKIK